MSCLFVPTPTVQHPSLVGGPAAADLTGSYPSWRSGVLAICPTRPTQTHRFCPSCLPEIRPQIYEHVFGHESLHIFIYEKNLVCLVCRNPTAVKPDGHEECIGMSLSDSERARTDEGLKQQQQQLSSPSSSSSLHPGRPEKREQQHLAALLATADTLYRTHPFHLSNLTSTAAFPRRLNPRQRALVRHVRIDLALGNVTCDDFLLRNNWPTPPTTDGEDRPEPEYPFRIERFTSKAPM
ncbi:hypothetical protein PG999_010311 [Apiospora kogelbergensis]|uniref:DUF7730 domain-containing protein n=1 Tax=Apiospora kogelbergensis TaxID=1337665 RepID=A0AAW0QBV4_9PEZI